MGLNPIDYYTPINNHLIKVLCLFLLVCQCITLSGGATTSSAVSGGTSTPYVSQSGGKKAKCMFYI
jgi:hypothetical protein